MKPPFYIFGAGGHGKCVAEAAIASGMRPDAFLDDHSSRDEICGIPVFDPKIPLLNFRFIVAIGNCAVRKEKFQWLIERGGTPETIIHPRAYVSPSAKISPGSVVLHFATADAGSEIGENTILNVGSTVCHDCRIGSHCHIAPNSAIGGNCVVGDEVWIGLGSHVREGTKIGDRSFVCLGAVVPRNMNQEEKAISPASKLHPGNSSLIRSHGSAVMVGRAHAPFS